jgi:hypothetical protein
LLWRHIPRRVEYSRSRSQEAAPLLLLPPVPVLNPRYDLVCLNQRRVRYF